MIATIKRDETAVKRLQKELGSGWDVEVSYFNGQWNIDATRYMPMSVSSASRLSKIRLAVHDEHLQKAIGKTLAANAELIRAGL